MFREQIHDREIHIVTGGNAAFVPGICVTTASALESLSKNRTAHIHILDGGVSMKDRNLIKEVCGRIHPECKVDFYQLGEYDFSKFAPGHNGSRMFYARLAMAEILSNLEKVIYIDSDTVVLGDFDELWSIDIGKHMALACKDKKIRRLSEDCPWVLDAADMQRGYFNSGLMVANLTGWRKMNLYNKSVKLSSKNKSELKFWDQTLLNYLLKDEVEFVSEKWNWQQEEKPLSQEVGVIHFTSPKKPWLYWGKNWRFITWRKFYRNYYRNPVCLFLNPISFRGLIDGWCDELILTNRVALRLKIFFLKLILIMTSNNKKRGKINKSLEFYEKIKPQSNSLNETARSLR
jgi:lipopolysaccharide biosynthesis glycosyltransferase